MKTDIHMSYLAEFFLELEMLKKKLQRKSEHIFYVL
jgi:hypothetical protein